MANIEQFKAPDNMWNKPDQAHSECIGSSEDFQSESETGDRGCVKGSNFIGEYMFELWKNQCLCDVKLQVEDKSFLAHKIVLAAFSDVFCPTQPKIRPTVCVDLPSTTPDAVYQILMYLYTSEMHLTDCNLEAVLNAACFMGITDVVDMIKAILDRPTVENVALYMEIRKRQGMPHSLLNFKKLCQDNFAELVDTRSFLCLKFEELEKLLQNPCLLVNSEMDTVRGVISWLEFNPLGRTQHTARLLELINLECVDTADLVRLKEEKQHLFHDISALEVIMDALIKRAKACAEKAKSVQYAPSSKNSNNYHCDRKCSVQLLHADPSEMDNIKRSSPRRVRVQCSNVSNNKAIDNEATCHRVNNEATCHRARPSGMDPTSPRVVGRLPGMEPTSPHPYPHSMSPPKSRPGHILDLTWTETSNDPDNGSSGATQQNKSGNAKQEAHHQFKNIDKTTALTTRNELETTRKIVKSSETEPVSNLPKYDHLQCIDLCRYSSLHGKVLPHYSDDIARTTRTNTRPGHSRGITTPHPSCSRRDSVVGATRKHPSQRGDSLGAARINPSQHIAPPGTARNQPSHGSDSPRTGLKPQPHHVDAVDAARNNPGQQTDRFCCRKCKSRHSHSRGLTCDCKDIVVGVRRESEDRVRQNHVKQHVYERRRVGEGKGQDSSKR